MTGQNKEAGCYQQEMSPWLRKRDNKKFSRLDTKVSWGPAIGKKDYKKFLATMCLEEAITSFTDQRVKNRGVILNLILHQQSNVHCCK
jgi:hypothetical protein